MAQRRTGRPQPAAFLLRVSVSAKRFPHIGCLPEYDYQRAFPAQPITQTDHR